ncbi:MAG: hypothetical protein NTW25_15950 [Candidatus Kapabacteria bacterium]|nr:hypothetical protein [Candidatus Kapabacteria bacterium]
MKNKIIIVLLSIMTILQSCSSVNYTYKEKVYFNPEKFSNKIVQYNEPFIHTGPKLVPSLLLGNAIILGGGYALTDQIKKNETNIGLNKDSVAKNYNTNLIITGVIGLIYNWYIIDSQSKKNSDDKDVYDSQLNEWAANELNTSDFLIGYNADPYGNSKKVKSLYVCSESDLKKLHFDNLSDLRTFENLVKGAHYQMFIDTLVSNSYEYIPKSNHYQVYKYFNGRYPQYLKNRINENFAGSNDYFEYFNELSSSNLPEENEYKLRIAEELFKLINNANNQRDAQETNIKAYIKTFNFFSDPKVQNYVKSLNDRQTEIANEKEKEIQIAEAKRLEEERQIELARLRAEEERKEKVRLAEVERINNFKNAYNKGLEDYKAEYYVNALKFFMSALDYQPIDGNSYYYVGNILLNYKKYASAIEAFNKAITFKTDLTDVNKKLDLATKMYNSPEEVKKREEEARIAEERRREEERIVEDRRREQEREYQERRKVEANAKSNFECMNCGKDIQSKDNPGDGKCPNAYVGSSHAWWNLGKVGDNTFECKNCGKDIQSKDNPGDGKCPKAYVGSSHAWRLIGR